MADLNGFDGFLGNIRFRRSISKLFFSYLLCAELVHGQECPTLPCTQSIAVYGIAPPPGIISTPQATPPSTSTTASSTESSTTTALTPTTTPGTSTTASSTKSSTTTALTTPSSTLTSSIIPTTSTQQSTSTVPNAAQDPTQSRVCAFPCTESVPLYPVSYYNPSPSSIAALSVTPTSSTSATPSNIAAQQGASSEGSTSASPVRVPSAITNATISSRPITNATYPSQPTGNVTNTTNCGQCSVLAEQVQVYYWPTQSVRSDCARASSVVLQSSVTYGINATKTLSPSGSVGGGVTTDVVDGFTFTYPSIYVSVIGPLFVSDSCGVLGATYTNPPPVAVQAITTASYDSWPSTCRTQGGYVNAVLDTLAISDIACPTWGVSDPFLTTCNGDAYLTATYGAPYNPVILVPTEILAIDASWGRCTKVPSNGPFTLPCGIYDPPRALHSASALGPAVTLPPADPQITPQPDLAQPQPANTGSPQLPLPTTPPSSNAGTQTQPSKDPTDPYAPAGVGNQGSANNDPPLNPTTAHSKDNDPSEDPTYAQDPASVAQSATPANGGSAPEPQVVPQTTVNLYGSQQSPGLAGPIYAGLSGNPPAAGPQGQSQGGSGQGANPGFSTQIITPLAGVALTITNPSAVEAAGSTLTPGGPAVTKDGTYYSLAPSGNLIAGTVSSGDAPAEAPAVLTFAGSTYSANAASQFIVAGQTLAPGAAISVSGTPISLASGGAVAVVGTNTQTLKDAPAITPAPAVLSFAGSSYTADASSHFIINGQTLAQGAAIMVSGTPISLPSGGTIAVIGSSTQSLKRAPAITPAPAVLSFGGSSYTADASSDFIIDGQTLTPGAAITVSGTPISLASGGAVAVVGTSTQPLKSITPVPAVLSFDGSSYTADASSDFVINGQTLTPGGVITVSGTRISLPSGGAIAVIGSSTQSLANAAIITPAPVLTFDGSTYTADASSDFIIAGQTLTPGGIITISGTPISYDGSGNDVVIGTSTESLATAMITPADIMTVDGQVFTANPTAFSIDGTTISAGGPGVTISGTPVSLEPGGVLVVGTSSIDLPNETGAGGPLAFEGGQGKVRIPSIALLIGWLGFCIMFGGLL